MFLKIYLISLLIFLSIDMVWLSFLAKDFYFYQIGFLMNQNINWLAVILFYLIFNAGLVFFVINPSILKHSWPQAFLFGAFFGLVSYATYDLTNLATIKNWPFLVTIVDLVWGIFLGATVSIITYFISIKFF